MAHLTKILKPISTDGQNYMIILVVNKDGALQKAFLGPNGDPIGYDGGTIDPVANHYIVYAVPQEESPQGCQLVQGVWKCPPHP
jgi:hypothetical protein